MVVSLDQHGHVLLQEDPGGNPHYIARIWQYDIATDTLTEIAHHDPARFTPGMPGFLTQDEESSGIIDASAILGRVVPVRRAGPLQPCRP